MGEVLRLQKDKNAPVETLSVTPRRLRELLELVSKGIISTQAAKKVFDLIEQQDKDPKSLLKSKVLNKFPHRGPGKNSQGHYCKKPRRNCPV